MKYGLQDTTIEQIRTLFEQYPQVEQATLYGSRAAGNYKNGSDIDLTLYGTTLTFSTLKSIINDFDTLYLPYSIDLSIFANISDPDIIDHIQRVGIIFYKRHSKQVNV
ncbi:MAG: nucleotidyltransferase domain-containing protein [Chlorobiaceae bacterium]